MSRCRFRMLSGWLTFDDTSTRKERAKNDPKFFKMRFFDQISEKVRTAYEPDTHFCIDEMLGLYEY